VSAWWLLVVLVVAGRMLCSGSRCNVPAISTTDPDQMQAALSNGPGTARSSQKNCKRSGEVRNRCGQVEEVEREAVSMCGRAAGIYQEALAKGYPARRRAGGGRNNISYDGIGRTAAALQAGRS
jgi:hypothetical protein